MAWLGTGAEGIMSEPWPPVRRPTEVILDGQMCEDIRIGIHVRQAFEGKMFRKKGGGISYSFGSAVLDMAGGFRKFLEEWEEDPRP